MPINLGCSIGKPPCSAALSDYYQHDKNESLDAMTIGGLEPPSARSIISTAAESIGCVSEISIVAAPAPSLSSPRKPTGSIRYRGFPHHREVDEEGSRIPRRVKSSPATSVSGKTCISNVGSSSGARSSYSTIVRGSSEVTGHSLKKSAYTNSIASNVSGVVSHCLLSNPIVGDGISLDPEVDIWLDLIPLSRKPFKNFHRDFSDGVLVAEIMAHFYPKKVDLHNYIPASASHGKRANYDTLNQKVFSKMGLKIPDNLIDGIIQAKPGFIEKALRYIHRFVDNVDRRQTEFRAKELSALAGSYNGSPILDAPYVEEPCLVRNCPGEIPDCVIYQNIKYHPSTMFEEMSNNEEQLREKNNELCNKVRRMETLLNLKESHLIDLTSKIHELRAKYELAGNDLMDNH